MKIRSLLPLLLLIAFTAHARADDDQVCLSGSTKNLEASIEACTNILQRPLMIPDLKQRAFLARGYYREHQHRFEDALSDYNAAIAVDPSNGRAHNARVGLYMTLGKFKLAQKENDTLMRMFPDQSIILNNSCWIHAALWELNAALADCNRSLALAPRVVETLDSRGFVHLRMKNYKQALADYNAALALDPKHATSLYVRGIIKRKLGDMAGGNADIQAAGKINPEVAESYAPYGLTQGN